MRPLVSEPCQITWFSYPPACGSGNFLTFQNRAESPGSLTRAVPPSIRQLFQSRAKPPGSLTLREGTLRARCFRAMPNHPVPIRCLHTHPHTGTRATTAKDSPHAHASPHALCTHARRPRRVLHAKHGQPSCRPRAIQAPTNQVGEASGPLGHTHPLWILFGMPTCWGIRSFSAVEQALEPAEHKIAPRAARPRRYFHLKGVRKARSPWRSCRRCRQDGPRRPPSTCPRVAPWRIPAPPTECPTPPLGAHARSPLPCLCSSFLFPSVPLHAFMMLVHGARVALDKYTSSVCLPTAIACVKLEMWSFR